MATAFYTLISIIGTILFITPMAVGGQIDIDAMQISSPDLGFATSLGLFLLIVILPTLQIYADDGRRGINCIVYGCTGFFLLVVYSVYVHFTQIALWEIHGLSDYYTFVYNFVFRLVGVLFGFIFFILTLTIGETGKKEMLKLAFFFLIALLILYAFLGVLCFVFLFFAWMFFVLIAVLFGGGGTIVLIIWISD